MWFINMPYDVMSALGRFGTYKIDVFYKPLSCKGKPAATKVT